MRTADAKSIMYHMAVMMTAASEVFGMYLNVSVRKPTDNITNTPVTKPPYGVRTPLALLTAVRVNEPVTGIECINEPKMLQNPRAINSWVASIGLPLAGRMVKCVAYVSNRNELLQDFDLQNAFATTTISRNATNANEPSDAPNVSNMSTKS